jgi:hypothetical protein
MATALLSRSALCDAPRVDKAIPNTQQRNLLKLARREAAGFFRCLERGHSLESLRATIGVSPQEESELAAFVKVFPEEGPFILDAIELRHLTLREFDELVRLSPPIVPATRLHVEQPTPEQRVEQSAKEQSAEVKPRATEVAQKLLDTLDGIDGETVRKALYFAAKCRGLLAAAQTHSTSAGPLCS